VSAHFYTKTQRVEQPAIGILAKLDWRTGSAWRKAFGATRTLRRETAREVQEGHDRFPKVEFDFIPSMILRPGSNYEIGHRVLCDAGGEKE
jgi:hypothetical protein